MVMVKVCVCVGGDGDDDSMDDDEHDDEVLEDNRSGPDEEQEEQQDPFQKDHVEVTDLMHPLNRNVTPPLPPDSD
jgi:hypothetical protein